MSFIEAMLLLLPPDVGGRSSAVAPRDGSYRPFARVGDELLRVRLIEGPALLAPGEAARVVFECDEVVANGAELQLVELGEQVVGFATVLRVMQVSP